MGPTVVLDCGAKKGVGGKEMLLTYDVVKGSGMQTLVQGFVNVGVGVFLVCDLKEERGPVLWLCWRRRRRRRRFGAFGGFVMFL